MSKLIASLPMYDFDSIKEQTNRLWQLIRQTLPDTLPTPQLLNHPSGDLSEHWKADNLFLSQSCGWPLITELNKQPLVTPVYDLPGCGKGYYSSAIIVRGDSKLESAEQLCRARLVINNSDSWSGYHALLQSLNGWGLSTDWDVPQVSGSHQQSLTEIINQRADFAAVDAVSWHYIKRHNSIFNTLKVLAWTQRVPALPLISSLPAKLQSELRRSLLAMNKIQFYPVKQLGIVGFTHFTLEQYQKELRDKTLMS